MKFVAAQVNCFNTQEKGQKHLNHFILKTIIDSTEQKGDFKATQGCGKIFRKTIINKAVADTTVVYKFQPFGLGNLISVFRSH